MRARLLLVVLLVCALPVRSADAARAICRDVTFPVALGPEADADWTVAGLLCDAPSHEIQVLLAGATESGLVYWDFPGADAYRSDPVTFGTMRQHYSYAKYLADRGRASLTIDRIGTGHSGRPDATEVTIQSNAFVVHQVVRALSDGSLTKRRYDRVVGVGRSLAAAVLYVGSVTYDDFDALLVQSFRSHKQPAFPAFATTFEPAPDAPPGYLTTRAGTRAASFFNLADADPAVVAHEEATKDTITLGEVETFPLSWDPGAVDLPVLSVVGDADPLFCSGPECPEAEQEEAVYASSPCFQSVVVANAGHDMNLQIHNHGTFDLMLDWAAHGCA